MTLIVNAASAISVARVKTRNLARLFILLFLAVPSAFAQSSASGGTVASTVSGTTGTALGSRGWAPGPLYPNLPIATVDITPPDTSGYTILADVTSFADLNTKIATAAAGCDNGGGSGSTGYIINVPQLSVFTVTSAAGIVLQTSTCTTSWIVIQTKGLNWTIFPWTRDTRIDPSTAVGTIAKFTSAINAGNVMSAQNIGVNRYWIRGLDLEMTATTAVQTLINLTPTSPSFVAVSANLPDHIVFDHIYGHGGVANNVGGIELGGNYIAVVDSWLSDFKSTANDTQAVFGFAGGPWRVRNNFIEATGENILFGGSNIGPVNTVEGVVPHDYTEEYNWLYKPLQWMSAPMNAPTGVVYEQINRSPFAWDVKNIHEFKFCVRCLVQYEILENNWSSAQGGYNILVNQAATQNGLFSTEQDITFQYLRVKGGVSAIQSNAKDTNATVPSFHDSPRNHRIMFRHISFEGLSQNNCDDVTVTCGLQSDWLISSNGGVGLILDHITSTAPSSVSRSIVQSDGTPANQFDFAVYFSNNIISTGTNGFRKTAAPSGNNNPADPKTYWGGLQDPGFFNNVITDCTHPAGVALVATTWFVGTQCPNTMADVGFVNWNGGSGGNYSLVPGSLYSSTGLHPCHENPDGTGGLTDCGADQATIAAQTAGLDTPPSLWPDSRSGGHIALNHAAMTCNASNTLVITPVAGTQGGSLFVQSGLGVMQHGTVIVPTASSTSSITIVLPTYSGAVSAITATDLGGAAANLMTFTAANTLHAGDLVTTTVTDNPNAPAGFFNLTDAPVHSATGTLFRVYFPHANVASAVVTGTATSKLPITVNNFGLPLTASVQCN